MQKETTENTPIKAPTTINAYIAQFSPEQQILLKKIQATIREAAPDAVEKISYAMPTYYQNENLVHFALYKKHVGFYPASEAMVTFSPKLAAYKTSKGAIQFPLDKPIPYELIKEITQYRVKRVQQKFQKKTQRE